MRNPSAPSTVTSHRPRTLTHALALAVVAASLGSHASVWGDTYGSNGGTTLNLATSWIDETTPANTGIGIPGATDIAAFDSNAALTAATTFSLGAPTSWLGILIQNPGAAVTIGTGANPLTLGASGIDMSAAVQNLTVAPSGLTLAAAQTWNVVTARTLTVSSPVDNGGNLLTTAGAGTTVISGTLSDTGGLLLSGPGIVTLSGANTYSGPTTLNAGTLNINSNTAIGTGTFTIAGGTINNSSTAAITNSSNNAQHWNGSFTFTGTQALDLGNGAVTLGATPVLTVAASTLTEDGVISGGFGLTKAGAGTLALTAANTFSGPVTINAGILNFNSLAALGAGTVLNFGGGTLQYAAGNTADISTDSVTFTGNATLDTNGNSVTLANSIGNGGAGGFTKTGTGTLALAATNAYSGNTSIAGSTTTAASVLTFSSLASLGSGTAIAIGNGTLQYNAGNTADITSRAVSATAALATIDLNGNSVTYANAITGNSTLTMASTAGPATFTVNAANFYAGNTTINAGITLTLGNAAAFQNSLLTLNSGSTLNFGTATAVQIGALAGAANVQLTNAASQPVTITFGGASGTYTGILSDGGSNLPVTKVGAGTQIFNNANTYNGDTVVDGGELEINFTAPSTQTADILYQQVATGSITQGSEGRLVVNGSEFFMTNRAGTTTYQQFASTLINSGASEIAMLGRSSGSKPELFLYAINRNVGATVDFSPSTGNGSGAFTTSTNNASGILGGWATYNGGTEWARATTSGGSTGPVTNGIATGITILGGATYTNSFASTAINTDMTANLTAPANNTTGSLRFNNAIANVTLTTTGSNVIASGGILVTSNVVGNVAYISPAASNSTLTSGNGTDLIVIDNDPTTGSSLNIQTPIVNNGATSIGLTKSGNGTLVLSGNNTFTGGLYLNAGTVQIANAGALNSSAPNSIVFGDSYLNTGSGGPTLTLLGNSLTVPQISTSGVTLGTAVIQNANAASAVLTVNGSGNSTFNGTILNGTGGGTLGLTVSGSGTLTLSGANTYTGNTTISSGKLALVAANNNIASSKNILVGAGATFSVTGVTNTFSIASGQTLAGSGTILGTVNVPASAVVNPGTSGVGTLTTGGLTLNSNAIINFDFNGSANDLINVTNSNGLTINGSAASVNLDLYQVNSTTPFATPGVYDLFQYTGSIGGAGLSALTDANIPFGLIATFGTANVSGTQYVTLTLANGTITVPTWALTGGGSWNVASNWNPTGIPSGQGQTAVLGTSITAPSTVTLDATQTVGTLTFNNTNAYTLAASGSESLVLDNGTSAAHLNDTLGSHSITAPVILDSNTSVSVTAGVLTLAGVVSEGTAGKSITMNGGGTLALANANTYTGGTTIGSGTVQVGNNAALGVGSLTFAANANLQAGAANLTLANNIAIGIGATGTVDTQAQTMTLTGVISSTDASGTLSKIGSGTLVVTGTNSITGAVTVNAGTLQIGDGVTNGSFLNATLTTNAALSFNTVGALTLANVIGGAGEVVQNGNNTITLTGINSFSGGLVINSGVVYLGGAATGPTTAGSGTITINNGGELDFNGYNASTTPQYTQLLNNVIIGGGVATIGGTPRGDFSGSVSGNGTLNYKAQYVRGAVDGDWSGFYGLVNVIPTVANGGTTAGGDFRINTFAFNAPNAVFNIESLTNVYTVVSGGIITLGDITGSGVLASGSSALVTVNVGSAETAGQTTVFNGTIGDGGHSTTFNKNGPGTLDLAGSNTFSGGLGVNQGTLTFINAASKPANVTSITVASGATLDLAGWSPYVNSGNGLTATGISGAGTIGSSSTTSPSTITDVVGTSTFAGSIIDNVNGGNQTVGLNISGATLTLSGTNTYTGGTMILSGKLTLGAGGTTGSIVATPSTSIFDNGTFAFNRSDNFTFAASINQSGNVTQVGPGVVTLTNANTYTGTTTITGGKLQLGNASAIGVNSPLVVTAGTLDLNGFSTTVGSLSGAAAGVIDNVAGGGASILTTGTLNADATYAGSFQNTSGTVGLNKVGTGNLTLSGTASTNTGTSTLTSGGLYITNTTGSALGGNLVLNGGTLGGTGTLGATITAGTAAHLISPGANNSTTPGTLTAGGLTTNANTTLVFDLTTPNGGTNDLLAITGNIAFAGGNVTINSISNTGASSLGYYKVMTYGGTVSGVSSLLFAANANTASTNVLYTLDTSTAGVLNIHKGFIGDVNDSGTVDITDLNLVLANLGTTTSSWSLGNFDGARTIDLTDLNDVLNHLGTTIAGGSVIVNAPVPEPTSLGLLALGGAALLARRRKA